eukprot:Nitzschia sp. Nitz4//scaffold207_size38617//7119//8217//NITZ4_007672-RA/size38617-augustus-gene-0.9-mRNA-1//1//CDS//3329541596//3601//frame0
MKVISLLLLLLSFSGLCEGARRKPPYTEEERQAEYHRRGNTWPPKIHPDTPGWKRILNQRFSQVRALSNTQMKWDGHIQTLSAAIVKNYTEFGWGLTQAPKQLTEDVRQAIYEGLPNARLEGKIDVIDGPEPLFIDRSDLTKRILKEVQPILEAWSGIELLPTIAYGFRLYQNNSRLWMHVDKAQTHVISCIFHIASSDDAEPWPIVIEDYAGDTISVVLKPGDLLLYESSKNFHGRPSHFNGSWYTSVFVHFYPKEGDWKGHNHDLDSHYAIPPDWYVTEPSNYPEVTVYGTSIMMPDCPDSWCPLLHAVEYEGPGTYGTVMTGGGKTYSLGLDDVEGEL